MALNGAELNPEATFQPQNNKQAYLAYAVGLLTDPDALPEPRTNEEALMKQLCLNGTGASFTITDASKLFYDGARLDALSEILALCEGVTSCEDMFRGAKNLTSTDCLKDFDTSAVTDMAYMFCGCTGLASIDLSGFNTSKVTDMRYMFNAVPAPAIDVSNFDTSRTNRMDGMFDNCRNTLEEIIGYSALCKVGMTLGIPAGTSSQPHVLRRLTFRTDLPEGVYAVRSAINIQYCNFTNEGLAEMFSTLPDVSDLGLSASYTKITITGNPCIVQAELTDETRAIATDKGWTLVE